VALDPSYQLKTLFIPIFSKDNSQSSQHSFVYFLTSSTILVQLEPIFSLLEDSHAPMHSSLGRRFELLIYVIAMLLEMADMCLNKILQVVSKANVENPIVINRKAS